MKPYPWKCASCRERAVSPSVLEEYATRLDHDGKSYEVRVPNLAVLLCGNCGAVELTDEAGDRLVEGLRRAAGLLTPAEIRAGRESHGLTQKQLAAHLRISETSLSRWETGAQMQQRCMDLLLRATFGLAAFRRFVGIDPPAWEDYARHMETKVTVRPKQPRQRDADAIWTVPQDMPQVSASMLPRRRNGMS